MGEIAALPVENRLISGLPRQERSRILACCEPVGLVFGEVLYEPDTSFDYVYFPQAGFISLVALLKGHPALEIELIGSEGMLGATLVLGVREAPLRAVVQGAGMAWRIGVPQFLRELQEAPFLLKTLKRYLYVLMMQLSKTAACTHFHEVELRLARWLLMTHDRAHVDHFHLTHQFLADMLGVQRSAITIAAGVLKQRELISYSRGEIHIMDRKGLEAACCECYQALISDYARLLK